MHALHLPVRALRAHHRENSGPGTCLGPGWCRWCRGMRGLHQEHSVGRRCNEAVKVWVYNSATGQHCAVGTTALIGRARVPGFVQALRVLKAKCAHADRHSHPLTREDGVHLLLGQPKEGEAPGLLHALHVDIYTYIYIASESETERARERERKKKRKREK